MKNAFANKVSYFIITFIFLIITASFLFSGYDNFNMGGTTGSVATVDGTPISQREYQNALNRQMEFYNQMMGGSGLTQKQMEDMGIKESVLNSLVQQKLILNTASQLGMMISLDEIKNEIKSLNYFKTNDQFDVNLYRNMLQGNGYTPTQFEQLIGDDLKQKKVEELFKSALVSEGYVTEVLKFKNKTALVQGIKLSRQSLSPLVSISEAEVKDYLAKPENKKTLEDSYQENLSKYNKPEEVKARHILISGDEKNALEKITALKTKVNPKNFAQIANKETQDPSGKNKGGDLGWFSSGRMVPEFEKVAFALKKGEISSPVKTQFGYHIILVEDKKAAQVQTLDSVKSELARMALQKTKGQDLDKLLKSTSKDLSDHLTSGNFGAVEVMAKKTSAQLFKDASINQFDQMLNSIQLSATEAKQIFEANPGSLLNLGNSGTIFLLKVIAQKEGEVASAEQVKAETTTQTQQFSRRIRDEVIKTMNNKAKIVTNKSLM